MATITQPVGRGASNGICGDIKLVQQLLNRNRQPPLTQISEDGVVRPETIAAIEEFQRRVVRMSVPDGRVDPNGATFRALSVQATKSPTSSSKTLTEGLALNGVKNQTAFRNANTVLQSLKSNGITSARALANVLAQVHAECNFMPQTEGNYSAANLLSLYGPQQKRNKVRFNTLAEAQAVVDQGHEAVFEKIYGGRFGNDTPGDGYKYRGRGFIQLTFKDNYRRVGKAIHKDLVGNPDLANDPKVATDILLNFLGVKSSNQSFLEDISRVNDKIGPAAPPASRAKFAEAILDFV